MTTRYGDPLDLAIGVVPTDRVTSGEILNCAENFSRACRDAFRAMTPPSRFEVPMVCCTKPLRSRWIASIGGISN
jgi:hypothetical protein